MNMLMKTKRFHIINLHIEPVIGVYACTRSQGRLLKKNITKIDLYAR